MLLSPVDDPPLTDRKVEDKANVALGVDWGGGGGGAKGFMLGLVVGSKAVKGPFCWPLMTM